MLPSFIVIGTKRGGSTALYEYLVSHPAVVRSKVKKGSHYFDVNFERGWEWFRSTFPLAGRRGVITGEASPYYMFHPLGMERIAAAMPGVKLLAVLREPVARAWSQYQFECRRGYEDLPFEEAVEREPERLSGEEERMRRGEASFAWRHQSYLARSRYAEQLERVYHLFPPERVLVLRSEALLANPDAELAKAWRFLDLPPHQVDQVRTFKVGGYQVGVPGALRTRLDEYFAPHNRRLYELPGIDFRFEPASGRSPSRL